MSEPYWNDETQDDRKSYFLETFLYSWLIMSFTVVLIAAMFNQMEIVIIAGISLIVSFIITVLTGN